MKNGTIKGVNYLFIGGKMWGSDGSFVDSPQTSWEKYCKNVKVEGTLDNQMYEKYKDMSLDEFLKKLGG